MQIFTFYTIVQYYKWFQISKQSCNWFHNITNQWHKFLKKSQIYFILHSQATGMYRWRFMHKHSCSQEKKVGIHMGNKRTAAT